MTNFFTSFRLMRAALASMFFFVFFNSTSFSQSDNEYRIGVGDLLEGRRSNAPDWNFNARVDAKGNIKVGMIDEDVRAVCRTPRELADEIQTRFKKYLKNPQFNIRVIEKDRALVTVTGAVNDPARFELRRPLRLLQLIGYAKGLNDNVGRTIELHRRNTITCQQIVKDGVTTTAAEINQQAVSKVIFNLRDILRGDEKANPFIQAGDTIIASESAMIYVTGCVAKSSPFPFDENNPFTVSQAIEKAGGILPNYQKPIVHIIYPTRDDSGSIRVVETAPNESDTNEIMNTILAAGAIVEVTNNNGYRRDVMPCPISIGTTQQLPIRVIP